jgi:hypothetical protein
MGLAILFRSTAEIVAGESFDRLVTCFCSFCKAFMMLILFNKFSHSSTPQFAMVYRHTIYIKVSYSSGFLCRIQFFADKGSTVAEEKQCRTGPHCDMGVPLVTLVHAGATPISRYALSLVICELDPGS